MLLLKSFARDGLTDAEIAKDKLHINITTFYDWIKRFPEFSNAIKSGRAPVNVEVEDTFLEQKLKGQFVNEETTEKTVHKDKDGNVMGITEHKRVTKRFIPADTTAMIFYLKCRMRDKYNDKTVISGDIKLEAETPKLYEALRNPPADLIAVEADETEDGDEE